MPCDKTILEGWNDLNVNFTHQKGDPEKKNE